MTEIRTTSEASKEELNNRNLLLNLFENIPIPRDEKLSNNGLFLKRQELSKILFFNQLYQKILPVHGVIIEFGCRWGKNLVTLNNLRGIYEPYNYSRRIIGFDSFKGFKNVSEKDGKDEIISEGSFSVTQDYEKYLENVLKCHENECPLNHIPKNKIIKGNAPVVLKEYLQQNPQTIIAFAWFDFDIYEPTLECLKLIKPHLTKGAIIGFDELNDSKFPGETEALKEFADLNSLRIERNMFSAMQSYIVFE